MRSNNVSSKTFCLSARDKESGLLIREGMRTIAGRCISSSVAVYCDNTCMPFSLRHKPTVNPSGVLRFSSHTKSASSAPTTRLRLFAERPAFAVKRSRTERSVFVLSDSVRCCQKSSSSVCSAFSSIAAICSSRLPSTSSRMDFS